MKIQKLTEKNWDLIVVGGGLTGAAAAIAAARRGMQVLLAEQSGFLGGAACNCLVNPFMPFTLKKPEETSDLSAGIFGEICREMEKLGGYENAMFHEEVLKLVLDRMTARAGVTVLLHVTMSGAAREKNKLSSVSFTGKAGTVSFRSRYFIDATGDADLAAAAGCPAVLGREEDALCQPMTLCFRITNVDIPLYRKNKPGINRIYKEFQARGEIQNPRENVLIFDNLVKNTLHFNTTRIVKMNPLDPVDLTCAEQQGREQMFEMYRFLKENIPGFENSDISFSAPQIGIRESRMIRGQYLLKAEDVIGLVKFEDAIAAGNYNIDIHNPEGTGTDFRHIPKDDYYTVPYRCLVPKNAENLLVAGRCISADHEAQSSLRIMPICTCMGEAAGAAAAHAAKENLAVGDIDVKALQQDLKEQGAFTGA